MSLKEKALQSIDKSKPSGKKTLQEKVANNLGQELTMRSFGMSGTGGINPVGNTGIGDSQYDYRIPEAEVNTLGLIRATRQPGISQAANALVSGIGSGLLTATEDISYILDFDNNINRLLGTQKVDSNFVADWAKDNKEALYESLPIYRKDSSTVFDWNDSGFYWEAFRGMLDSAVGFGLVGMGAGAVVKGAGALVRLGAQAGKINKYKAYVDMFGKAVQQGKLGNASAAFITNYGEGKMMALELYESSYEKSLEALISDYQVNNGFESPDEETLKGLQIQASKIAGNQADTFQLRNMMFMATDYLQIKSIFKGANTNTRNLLPKPSFNQWAKTQLTTAPKEALEEIGQNVLQMEGEYKGEQQLRDLGVTVKDPITISENFGDRFLEFATSDQALLEGMMGLFSGPVQYAITTAPFQNTAAQKKQYNDQQAVIARNAEYFKGKTENVAKRKEAIEEAVKNGQPELANLLRMQEFDALALENFTHGTTENLETVLQEELKSEEYSAEEKKEIQAKLDRLTEMETEFNQYRDYANSHGVYANRLQLRQANDAIGVIENKTQQLTEKIQQDYSNLIKAHNKNADAENQVSFSDISQAIATNDFSGIPQQIKDSLMGNPEVGMIIGFNESLKRVESNLQSIQSKYKDMTQREYQLGYEMLKNTMLDDNLNTEEKIDDLNKLDSNTKGVKNNTLTNQIRSKKAKLETELAKSKANNDTGQVTPETKTAVNAKANTGKKKTVLEPEKKKELENLKSGAKLLGADGSNERAVEISKMSLEQIDKLTPEEKEELMGMYNEYITLSAEQREDPELDSKTIAELFEEDKAEIPAELKQEEDKDAINEVLQAQPKNTKDDDIEVRSYNSSTSEVNKVILDNEGKAENNKDAVDVKAAIFGSTNLKGWLENGQSKDNTEVTYKADLNNKYEGAEKAIQLFNKRKQGQKLTKAETQEVIDNLPIFFSVDSDPSVTAFIHTVKRGDKNTGSDSEVALRTQIIQSLLAGDSPKGIITGQYGGDLVTTNGEAENSILSIPDFLETKPGDIPILYVDGAGELKDSKTREKVTGKFSTMRVMLKGKGIPMSGALFTVVKKLNGETFPLKLNVKSLSNKEQELIIKLLLEAIRPSKSGVNYFAQTLKKTDPIWEMVDPDDIQYLTNSSNFKGGITFGQLLNFYVYEGTRSTSNPVTQLFVKNGIIHFGDQVMNEKNRLVQAEALQEFLSTYKTRNVDLRQFSTNPAYRNHILERGVVITDAQVDRPTLFKTTDQKEMDAQYGKDENAKRLNRYKIGTVYLKPEVSNPVSKPEVIVAEETKPLESKEKASKLPIIKTVPTVPQNKVNMDNIPSTSIPRKGRGRTLNTQSINAAKEATEANKIKVELETKKIEENTEKPCNKKPKK